MSMGGRVGDFSLASFESIRLINFTSGLKEPLVTENLIFSSFLQNRIRFDQAQMSTPACNLLVAGKSHSHLAHPGPVSPLEARQKCRYQRSQHPKTSRTSTSSYPSSHNHVSVENGCNSNISFLSFRVIFHWTHGFMGERVFSNTFGLETHQICI